MKPEDIKAIELLESTFQSLESNPNNEPLETTCNQGTWQKFTERIKARRIPSGEFWRWNQTRARKNTHSARLHAEISFSKLIPRKLKTDVNTSTSIPNYKLWQFDITFDNGEYAFVLWCEKGKTTDISNLDELFDNVADDSGDQEEEYVPKAYAGKISYICN